jgi:hypothetical protein
MGFINRLENAQGHFISEPKSTAHGGTVPAFLIEMKTGKRAHYYKNRLQHLTCGSRSGEVDRSGTSFDIKNTRFLTWVPSKRACRYRPGLTRHKCGGMNFIVWCETDASPVAASEGMKNTHFRRRNKPHSTSPPAVNLENSSRKVASVRNVMQPMPQDLAVLSFYIRVCSDLNRIEWCWCHRCTHPKTRDVVVRSGDKNPSSPSPIGPPTNVF